LSFENEKIHVINKDDFKLIITHSEDRAKKDSYNREKAIKKLEKKINTGKLSKAHINNRGYNKFLKMEGDVALSLDKQKVESDSKWDGLKGYLTNSSMSSEEVLGNYKQLWQIEKAFRVAKNELKIRPIFHYKRERIEAHICLNFTAYKVYKELDRILKENKVSFSPEKVIEVIQNIFELTLITPNNDLIKKTLILTEEQKIIQKLFKF
jgi:hypothetical protein